MNIQKNEPHGIGIHDTSTSIKSLTLNEKFIITFVKFWELNPLKMHLSENKIRILHYS
jgi:hypothetical protein